MKKLETLALGPSYMLVKTVRKRLKITQGELADRLGYGAGGQEKISEMENRKRHITGPIRQALLNLLEKGE